jgi:hypothetical protein
MQPRKKMAHPISSRAAYARLPGELASLKNRVYILFQFAAELRRQPTRYCGTQTTLTPDTIRRGRAS